MKELTDALAAAGSPVSDEDQVMYTLRGLPAEYNAFATSIRVRSDSVSADELYALTLSEEISVIDRHKTQVSIDARPQALATITTNGKDGTRASNINPNFKGKLKNYIPNYSARFHTGKPRNTTSVPSPAPIIKDRTTCRICEKPGHSAIDCYNRMNYAFQGKHPPQKLVAMVAHSNSTSNEWIADTRATNHLTHDLSNMSVQSQYQGQQYGGSDFSSAN